MTTALITPLRHRWRMTTWLAAANLLVLLPMLVFAAVVLYRQVAAERAEGVATLQRRAAVAAAAVAREVAGALEGLRAVALTRPAREGDLGELHALAMRIVESDPRLAAVTVTDATGRLRLTTRRPFGTELPPSNAFALQREAVEAGMAWVSPLLDGAVTRQPTLLLAIPLDTAAHGRLALRASLMLDTIRDRLLDQQWPEDWVAAVIDQRMAIIARSRDSERYVGQPATVRLQQGIREGERVFEADTKDGQRVVTAVAPVPGTGWHVAVGQPVAALNAKVQESVASVVAAGVGCVAFALVIAFTLSRRIGAQLQAVVSSHASGATGPAAAVTIHEVAELDAALVQARAAALKQLRERSEMLDVLAHEVRQPLNNASAALQAASLTLKSILPPNTGDPLVRARGVLVEVQTSIDNTLAAATLLVRARSVHRQDADVDALIGVAIGDVPPQEASRVHVERLTATRTASLDFGLVRLALRNLLVNALKYSPPGSPVTLRVSDSDEPLALLLDVVDRGPGIDPEGLKRLFEPAPSDSGGPASRPGGRRQGLGLHIVRRVMELHGGSVQVEHTGPEGTTMRLVIVQSFDA